MNNIEYLKDKDGKLYTIIEDSSSADKIQVTLNNSKLDISKFTGFNNEFIFRNLYRCDDENQMGYASVVFDITNVVFDKTDTITIHNDVFNDVNYPRDIKEIDLSDSVLSIINKINNAENDYGYVKCYYAESPERKLLAFKTIAGGSAMNEKFYITLSNDTKGKFNKIYGDVNTSESEQEVVRINFIGGCDNAEQRSKIEFNDYENFNGDRYVLNDIENNNEYTYSKPLSLVPYINTLQDEYISYSDHTEMLQYVELVTEKKLYINSKNQTSVYDRFKPIKGELSIFPVKDFYFTSNKSVYGKNAGFVDEIKFISDANPQLFNNESIVNKIIYDEKFNPVKFKRQEFDISRNIINDHVLQFGTQSYPLQYEVDNIFDGKTNLSKINIDEQKGERTYLNKITGVTIPLTAIQIDKKGDIFEIELPTDENNRKQSLTDYLPLNNLFDKSGNPIDSEYDYYSENLNPDLCFANKLNPTINAWGMNFTDSFDQHYRLNTSKIFRYNNLSPNSSVNSCDILNNTHDAFYIMSRFEDIIIQYQDVYKNTNEIYRYVNTKLIDLQSKTVHYTESDWVDKLSDGENFNKLFNSFNEDKRINKKYSIIENNETILHGVRYKLSDYIVDEASGKYVEINKKYDGYKFTYVLIPLFFKANMFTNNKPTIIINNKDKYVILVSFYNTLYGLQCGLNSDESESESDSDSSVVVDIFNSSDFDAQFIRTFIYAGGYGLLKTPNILKVKEGKEFINIFSPYEMIDLFKLEPVTYNSDSDSDSDYSTQYSLTGISDYINNVLFFENDEYSIDSIKCGVDDFATPDEYGYWIVNDNFITDGKISINDDVVFTFKIKKDADNFSGPFNKYYDQIKDFNIYNIKYILENGNYNLVNTDESDSDSEKDIVITQLHVIEPDIVEVYDIFEPSIITSKTTDILGTDLKLNSDPRLQLISRHSGYYNPLAKDILFFSDSENTEINSSFKDSFGESFKLNDVFIHKYSENTLTKNQNLIYPYTGEYALTYKDINIFDSTFDPNYYLEQTSLTTSKPVMGTKCMVENNSLFGSKVLKLPNEIIIDTFNPAIEWDQELIGTNDYDIHFMYKEENDSTLNLYCFNQNILITHLLNETPLIKAFEDFINPEYSFNRTDEIEDDCLEYIKRNILRRYKLDKVEFYHLSEPSSDNNSKIENDYRFDNKDIVNNLNLVQHYSIKEVYSNRLDRLITYNMINGNKETFNMKLYFKLI